MKIYTKTGDAGETGLFGGERVKKADARVDAYGTVDETNAALGLARSFGLPESVDATLMRIQNDLFVVGAELACAPGKTQKLSFNLIGMSDVEDLENSIDAYEAELPPLKNFILPGGTPGAGALHYARTVCRRAERLCVALRDHVSVRDEMLVYLNRLSDLLFVLARVTNQRAGQPDVPWKPR